MSVGCRTRTWCGGAIASLSGSLIPDLSIDAAATFVAFLDPRHGDRLGRAEIMDCTRKQQLVTDL